MSTESDLIQRQREVLRQARVANRTRTDVEARAAAQRVQAQQQAEGTLAAATQQAETAQRQAQVQADTELHKATANAGSVLEQTQNQVAQQRERAKASAAEAPQWLDQVGLGEVYRSAQAQPAAVEPDSSAALQRAADASDALLSDIRQAVRELAQLRAEASAKRKALLWWVVAGLLGVVAFWGFSTIIPPWWLWLGLAGISAIAFWIGQRSWTRPRRAQERAQERAQRAQERAQRAIANRATLEPKVRAAGGFVNSIDGAVYVHVSAGPFPMGSELNGDERPVHVVTLPEYWIMQTPVTNAMYAKCVAAGVCTTPRNDHWRDPTYADHPVTYVDWDQASAYARWSGGRLPTEAEWEKAARGTDGRMYPWGNKASTKELCNFNGNEGGTTPVYLYLEGASPYGALDMAGNVWEWVSDWYGKDSYRQSPRDNPQGPERGKLRVLRGGSWSYSDGDVRSANRYYSYPDCWVSLYGFRCVRSQ